ncbi:sugar ABC transporter permease [Vallitalea longa]|uniref:Sugar ABC transporter permease n=1 Tax=Vallitalea longa TaxID=2936439 RepID=A0A9W5YHS3_9FIRM|nr:extracellular solute-binding protein [Vallitalea longa]GKX31468.1 sugar ABC transporter permease [Vallitalea longa]
MKKANVKCISLLLIMIMMLSLLAGCGKTENKVSNESEVMNQVETKNNEEVETEVSEVYPLEGDHKLTYWVNFFSHPEYATQGETPLYKEVTKRTGVQTEWIVQSAPEAFSLLAASGELPDLVLYNFITSYPGGPQAALDQGLILPLNDYMQYAPNLMKYLEENPEVDKQIKTDDGIYYCFPRIRGGELLQTFAGPMVRKDLLEQNGLDTPVTIDDWHKTLTVFKDLGIQSPLTSEMGIIKSTNAFVGAYNTSFDMHLENGKIVYGPIQPGFKEFLKTFSKWYQEGLIDKDIASLDKAQVAAKMTSGQAVAAVGHTGSRMGAWLTAMADDSNYGLIPTQYPVLIAGDYPEFGQSDLTFSGIGTSISTKCEDIEAAMRLLDYGYSEEGHMLYNFGIEGESYEMIDGYPTYTEYIMNNPDGKNVGEMLMAYTHSAYFGPMIQDIRYMEQYSQYQEQKDAINIWKDTNVKNRQLPLVTLSKEEVDNVASIQSEITAYADEFFYKVLFGTLDVEAEWDNYVETINKMGLNEMLSAYETALERYNNR